MNINIRYLGVAAIATLSSWSCSVPPVMILKDASCNDLMFLYQQQREEWRQAAGHPLYEASARGELERIEAALTAKGCLMPESGSTSSDAFVDSSEPTAAYEEIVDYAAEALFAAAPEEAITYAAAGETLTAAAPTETAAYLAAVLALFIEAPDAYLHFDSAWRNLYAAAPVEFRAIGADEKALYALIEPAEYAGAAASGRALLEAASGEFAAYNNAWTSLRSAAPQAFFAMANQQKALYAAAPNRLADADAAGLLAYAAAPKEFIALDRASLFVSVMEALQSAAPSEFAAYTATASGTEAQAKAVETLAAAAPKEVIAAAAIEKALQDILETLE